MLHLVVLQKRRDGIRIVTTQLNGRFALSPRRVVVSVR